LDLSRNQLSGSIPVSLIENPVLFMTLNLSSNSLQTIPSSFNTEVAIACDLSKNPFNCPIPEWTKLSCGATCK